MIYDYEKKLYEHIKSSDLPKGVLDKMKEIAKKIDEDKQIRWDYYKDY